MSDLVRKVVEEGVVDRPLSALRIPDPQVLIAWARILVTTRNVEFPYLRSPWKANVVNTKGFETGPVLRMTFRPEDSVMRFVLAVPDDLKQFLSSFRSEWLTAARRTDGEPVRVDFYFHHRDDWSEIEVGSVSQPLPAREFVIDLKGFAGEASLERR